jgi:apolipoprotein N-acyltransferase
MESPRRSATLSPMRGIPWRLLAAAAVSPRFLLDLPFPLSRAAAGLANDLLPGLRWFRCWWRCCGCRRISGGGGAGCFGWSFLAGWLTGALWFGANCYWVYDTMHLYGGMNEPMAVVCLVAVQLVPGLLVWGFCAGAGVIRRATVGGGSRGWLAAIPFLWTAMEFALARIPQFPWDLLGYSQVDNGLLTRLAPWTGCTGSAFCWLRSECAVCAVGWFQRQRKQNGRSLFFDFALLRRAGPSDCVCLAARDF